MELSASPGPGTARGRTPGPPRGLSSAEAARRLATHGPNRIVPRRRAAFLVELAHALADPMALMLLAAGVVYLMLGEIRDGTVLLVALVPVLGVDVFLELRSQRALKQLAAAVAPRARVLRDGAEAEIATEDVVPGDVLVLREGDVVHADGVVREATNLALDESAMTGESLPQDKVGVQGPRAAEEHDVVAGSVVVAGHGLAEVTVTGPRTRFGEVARLVAEVDDAPTPLQRKTSRLVRRLAILAVVVAGGIFLLTFARSGELGESFIAAVSIALASIPEEFPLVFTLFLSLGAWRLSKHRVLVRRITSVETLGATTVICVDKTGTLTHGRFALEDLVPLVPGVDAHALLETAVLACEKDPQDAMERAIVERAREGGVDVEAVVGAHALVRDHPFDAVGKHMSHAWRDARGGLVVAAKGAIEGILEHAAVSPEERARVESAHAELATRGARVLAVAVRRDASDRPDASRGDDERDLHVVGLLAFRDPLRPEVPAAVRECERAGITVKIITGDHALTAHAIADAAGITHRHEDGFVSGDDLDHIEPGRLPDVAREASVFTRVRPEQKHAIVDALARSGEVVAMTGDGINDAPALRRADIGIGMGRRGTDVARASAGLVLLDDDFGSIVATVREGRHIFVNIQRAFLYLVAFHVPIVVLAFVAPLLGLPPVLLPVHIVWLELVVHPVSALVFEAEPAPPDLMTRPPRDPAAPILPRRGLVLALVSGTILSGVALALYVVRLPDGPEGARAIAFAAVVVGALCLVFSERSDERAWWSSPRPRGVRFWGVWALVAGSLVAILSIGPAARTVAMAPLAPLDWLVAVAAGVAAVGWRAFGTGRLGAAPGASR